MKIPKDNMHHAYAIEGNSKLIIPQVLVLFKKDTEIVQNLYDTFYIEDAQALKNLASLKGDRRVFILSFNFITIEAQNALLKLLEEPNKNTHFFLILPNVSILLPTVLSRLYLIKEDNNVDLTKAKKFLKLSVAERLSFFEEMIKDKSVALSFLGELEMELYIKKEYKTLKNIQIAEKYMYDRSPSVKMLLEYVAVNI